jgi:hypothetical protein
MRTCCVFLQALPVALEGEDLAVENVQRREKTPAVEKTGLARREAHLLDWHELRVVKDKAMEHEASGVARYCSAMRAAAPELR